MAKRKSERLEKVIERRKKLNAYKEYVSIYGPKRIGKKHQSKPKFHSKKSSFVHSALFETDKPSPCDLICKSEHYYGYDVKEEYFSDNELKQESELRSGASTSYVLSNHEDFSMKPEVKQESDLFSGASTSYASISNQTKKKGQPNRSLRKKYKKKKKIKNLNPKPKQARSAFLFFFDVCRKELGQLNGVAKYFTEEIVDKWNALSQDERAPFEADASGDQERYFAELSAYKGKFIDPNKPKKFIDPNKPKKPMTPFEIFQNEYRIRMREMGISLREGSKMARAVWIEMSEEAQKPYTQEHLIRFMKYKDDMAKYVNGFVVVDKATTAEVSDFSSELDSSLKKNLKLEPIHQDEDRYYDKIPNLSIKQEVEDDVSFNYIKQEDYVHLNDIKQDIIIKQEDLHFPG